jgi:hypothetical protein
MTIDQHAASAHTTQTDPDGDRAEECAYWPDVEPDVEEEIEDDRAMLRRMAEIGMKMLDNVEREAAEGGVETLGATSLAYTRITRSIRQTMALRMKLRETLETREREAEAEQKRHEEEAERHRLDRRHRQVERILEAAVEAEIESNGDREDLRADLRERLDDDLDYELDTQSIGEIVTRLCRDLDITPEPDLWRGLIWEDEMVQVHYSVVEEDNSDPPAAIDSGHDPPEDESD